MVLVIDRKYVIKFLIERSGSLEYRFCFPIGFISMQKKIIVSFVCFLIAVPIGGYFYEDNSTQTQSNSETLSGDAYERPYSPSFGPEDAKITITEFFDPACEACRAFYPFVKEIISRHPQDVRVVLRYATFHQGSETVVRMLEATRLQNNFKPVFEALLEGQQQWASHDSPNITRAWEIAEEAGLDVEVAKTVMNTEAFELTLKQEKEDIRTLKISQTPTFFVNEKPLPSFGAKQLYGLVVSEIDQHEK